MSKQSTTVPENATPEERARALWEHQRNLDEAILKRHDKETARQQKKVDAMEDDGSPAYLREHGRLVNLINQGAALSERLKNHDEKELERMANAEAKKDAEKAKRAAAKPAAEGAAASSEPKPRGVTIDPAEAKKIIAAGTKGKGKTAEYDQDAIIGKLRAKGLGFQRIADLLAAEGVPTKRGGTWTSTTVKNVVDRLARTK